MNYVVSLGAAGERPANLARLHPLGWAASVILLLRDSLVWQAGRNLSTRMRPGLSPILSLESGWRPAVRVLAPSGKWSR